MDDQLSEYTDDRYWVHLTLPKSLDTIAERGLETGHPTTEEQLFSEYFPDSDKRDVVEVREDAENLLERVREDVYDKSSIFASRRECVAFWPGVEQAFEMRSAVLGDSVEYGAVIVDAKKIENAKMVLSEYQLIAQAMMHVNMYQTDETEMDSDTLVQPAWKYWTSATLTNSWEAVLEQTGMFDIPEVLVHGGVDSGAIVETMVLNAVEYDENDEAPPTVTPK